MPAFRELVVRALLTSFGLIDSWMLREPPLEVSNFATTHLNIMPGEKRYGSEQISCRENDQNEKNLFWNTVFKTEVVMVLPNVQRAAAAAYTLQTYLHIR